MSFLSRAREIKDKILLRGISQEDYWLTRLVGKGVSASGQNVTADSALRVSAVYACVKVLAETIASLPLMLYERVGEGKQAQPDHPLYDLVHSAPNDFQTSFEWREVLVAHNCLKGNSLCQKVETGSGELLQLIPLNPSNFTIARTEAGVTTYEYKEGGQSKFFPSDKVWHVRNMPISCTYNDDLPEGVWGASPIRIARDTIGLSLSADDYGSRFFSNMASVGLNAKFPAGVKLSENAREFLKNSLAEYAKPENKFKSIITEDGGELKPISMSNEDSQFLESRQFGVEEICRIFRVPPIMVGHPTNTMTFASAEQIFLAFTMFTIRPWCVRLEQSMNRWLLSAKDRPKLFFEFNLSGLLRGDIKSRYEAYRVGRELGWLNADEIRAWENMNPLPDGKGKVYLQPLNLGELGAEPPEPEPKKEPEPKEPQGGEEDEKGE